MELSMPGLKVGDPVRVLSGEFAGRKGRVQFILREDQLPLPISQPPRNIGVKLPGIRYIIPFAERELERIEER